MLWENLVMRLVFVHGWDDNEVYSYKTNDMQLQKVSVNRGATLKLFNN